MAITTDQINQLIATLKRLSEQPCYHIELDASQQPSLTGSKIGGLPYWAGAEELPVDSAGNKMYLLAQINCGEAGLQAPLPTTGMLQFFVSPREGSMYGCEGNTSTDAGSMRVIYHPTIGNPIEAVALEAMGVPVAAALSPDVAAVRCEMAFTVNPGRSYIHPGDAQFESLLMQAAQEVGIAVGEGQSWYDTVGNEGAVAIERALELPMAHHQLLGHPKFTQDDPRGEGDRHDTMLLQLDSEYVDGKEAVMWGDMGSGFFFIAAEDLSQGKLDDLFYCHDCG